jgi:NADH:ubiquinone oxidoreductase subunit F (NADH-binding)
MSPAMTAATLPPGSRADRWQPRLLPPPGYRGDDLGAHLRRHGKVPYLGGRGLLIPEVRAAGLTGRGGAAFPTFRKLAAVAAASGAVVVANGAETEPASAKDATLLRAAPHLVLDGLQLAAEAVAADRAVLYVPGDPRVTARLAGLMTQRGSAGLDRVAVEVITAPSRFLAGEESALASRVSGKQALPRFTPPRVFERGVAGRPTLVQNVETLAHLALIARHGARWFRGAGTRAEPGTMLCTVRDGDRPAAVVEAPLGVPLARLLTLRDNPRAVLVGGYHGAWIPADLAARLTLSNAALRPLGAATGAGVLAALPSDRCGLVETARVVRYLALESAGQCGPCRNGLPRISGALAELASRPPASGLLADLVRWAGLVDGRGACHHPDGTVRFVRSALRTFAAEVRNHQQGRCTAASRRPVLPVRRGPGSEEDWS